MLGGGGAGREGVRRGDAVSLMRKALGYAAVAAAVLAWWWLAGAVTGWLLPGGLP